MEFDHAVTIDRQASQVWDYLTDPDVAPDWMTVLESAEREGPLAVGSTIRGRAKLLGIGMDVRNEIVELDEPTRYALRGETPFPIQMTFVLEADGDRTHLTASLAADPGSFFPVGGSLLKRQLRKQIQRSAEAIKTNVEAR